MTRLSQAIAIALSRPVSPIIADAARLLAAHFDGQAVLFYGSVLRTGDLSGVLDFYVLTDGRRHRGIRGMANRWLWPDVSYHELRIGAQVVRAKVATMPLAIFATAASGVYLDTTIWTRFVQPAALVWHANEAARSRVEHAIGAATVTASLYAAALGPESGTARDYWRALFAETYRTEWRVEAAGRETQIIDNAGDHFDRLLPHAWEAANVATQRNDDRLTPLLSHERRRTLRIKWRRRQRAGKPLNLARLAKAAFTFDGAAAYAVWKVERHTGIHIPLTPWRERHPILAAPGVLWQVWRRR